MKHDYSSESKLCTMYTQTSVTPPPTSSTLFLDLCTLHPPLSLEGNESHFLAYPSWVSLFKSKSIHLCVLIFPSYRTILCSLNNIHPRHHFLPAHRDVQPFFKNYHSVVFHIVDVLWFTKPLSYVQALRLLPIFCNYK